MDHAWLDSLSEDWISQPESDTSAGKLPPLTGATHAKAAPRPEPQSRIPQRIGRSSLISERNSSPLVLNERSVNESHISGRRLLSRESKASTGDDAGQSPLAATNGSVIRNSVQHHSSSTRQSETPEWKRRLVHGKISYGEQRDLFSSAAAGLQDIFKPPPSSEDAVEQSQTTLPSSPPLHSNLDIDADLERYVASVDDDESTGQGATTPSPSPRRPQREIKYRLNVGDLSSSTVEDSGRCAAPQDGAGPSRKASGQSDIRNEDFSPILIGKHSEQGGVIDFAPIDVPVEQLHHKLERLQINQMLMGSLIDPHTGFEATEDAAANAESTDAYMRKGGFINLQRGGRSGDGSFYNRGLSSDLGADTSEMLPEESLQASTPKQFPTVRTQASLPRPSIHFSPSPSLPRAPFPSPDKRQVRQDSGDQPGGSPLKLFGPYDTFTNQTLLRRISQFEEASGSPSRASLNSPEQESPRPPRDSSSGGSPSQCTRAFSRFGGGDLDGYEFAGDVEYQSGEDSEVRDKENVAPLPALATFPSLQPPRELSPVREPELFVRRRRNQSLSQGVNPASSTRAPPHNLPTIALPTGGPASAMTPKRDGDSEGKRPRTSPSKDPTPKRRRTLHRSDVAFGRERHLAAVDSAHRHMQSMMGKKRKDAQPGDVEPTDPSAPPSRSILWPRDSTTPSPDSSQDEALAGSLLRAAQNNRPSSSSDNGSKAKRQPSIRTQDFVDQAAQIMAMIRSQVRPGLASLEESEAEYDGARSQPSLTDSYQESTNEPLSRPPSREGKPLPRIPQRQEDPELIKRLEQYQEQSDTGDVISSSLRSSNPLMSRTQEFDETHDGYGSTGNDRPIHAYDNIITDLPNVRITPSQAPNHGSLGATKDFSGDSTGRSTSRTYPTTSSRGSESRRTIMPESVSHLIPDRVGGMYLDKQHNIWIKRKDSKSASPVNVLPSDDSEEDPFASIPDLSVDITKELRNLRLATSQKESVADQPELERSPRSPLSTQERPGPHMASAAREQLGRLGSLGSASPTASLEGAGRDSGARRRNLTISFSSPIASVIHDVVAEDLDSLDDDPDESQIGAVRSAWKHGPQAISSRANLHGRSSSARGPGFMPRPVSRIDEQDEESTVEIQPDEDRRHASLSFIINHTPNNGKLSVQPDESAMIGRNVGKLSLSPLSEFTLDNSDQSFGFEVSYVMGRRHMATGDGSKRVLSMTIRELVDKLGEVEPYEPFWEDITELDLHGKQLASLHMLDEFCGRVITLDASGNKLGHLDGVPSTVRQLKVSQNMLTELTSWDHLMNLQYVDVSGNEVKSLSALKNLVHLRSIRADDNQLTSLDGFDFHDGLLSLRARNNAIESLDFSTVMLERLTELDLDGNNVGAIHNLEMLPTLSRLRLRGNRLRQLTVKSSLGALRELDVSDNELTELDLGNLPNIRSVHADRNRIHRLSGFEQARRLDSLSLREQRGDLPLDMSFLARAYEIRKLFLSGNYLGSFEPAVDFLNLQLLDLANCGLQRLPARMGQLMPNLRTLNLNFNAVADLSPLQFVPRLKKLLVAGNRLGDSTAVTQLLTEFPHLTQLDVRDNPVTLGFYAPVQVLVPRDRSGYVDPFTLPDADAERDELFARRLDEATRLRRRLHQIVLVASCRRLRKLDGLGVRRREVLAKDDWLEKLVAEGLVPELEETLVAQSDESHSKGGAPAAGTHRGAEAVQTVAANSKVATETRRHFEQPRGVATECDERHES
ncbi:septation initiation network scaffold protein cdc11 [Hirsutella rhossiliensis]|uniref:Septation initiation network scaffold protein cdc11 n=1 Tax=Hirsutella rhossiliensis TaxID=111463 RepID=A0A9P8SKV4_9HYPO|nr:septation initiation network scaffold protein cdc11 [Hirsutella rhossiliensis]KAH0966286.1 septation initiation network scaffold protein cdc11 [Hirsutella rhossiliensis]